MGIRNEYILYLGFFHWIGNIFGDILSYKERKERKRGRERDKGYNWNTV